MKTEVLVSLIANRRRCIDVSGQRHCHTHRLCDELKRFTKSHELDRPEQVPFLQHSISTLIHWTCM